MAARLPRSAAASHTFVATAATAPAAAAAAPTTAPATQPSTAVFIRQLHPYDVTVAVSMPRDVSRRCHYADVSQGGGVGRGG